MKNNTIPIGGEPFYSPAMLFTKAKNNFKTDYRSDKAREDIIKMISGLKNILDAIGYLNIKEEALKIDELADKIKGLAEDRILLKKKMKDLESDYI